MSRPIKKGTLNVSVVIRIIDSTSGDVENAVVFNTTGIDLWYRREGAVKTSITEVTLAALTTAHADGGFLFIGDGYYRLDVPDAAFATGVDGVMIGGTVTGMVVIGCYVPLTDLDLYDGVRAGLTALPNAVVDAAGGLVISDAGGLDIDAKLANTNEITTVRMAALTDWINGGRLDLILDIIAADVVNIDGAAMRGTDNAALASLVTAARMGALDDLLNGGRLDLLIDEILADVTGIAGAAMRGTNSAALASVCTESRLAALTDWINGGRLDLILDIIAADVVNIDGAAMRGTDGANTTAPNTVTPLDAAGIRTAIGMASANLDTQLGLLATAAALATVDGNVDANKVILDALGAVAAARLKLSAEQIIVGTVDTVTNTHTPTTTEFQADDITEATADHLNSAILIFTSGALAGQRTSISDYVNVGGIAQFTVVEMTEAPANNDTFIIL